MSSVNYLRVLKKCICLNCKYEGYDADFEKHDFQIENETENGVVYNCNIRMICPKCGVENKYKIVE